jgi:BirA family biotin operon repressor/biotin-[acetyl-CoA-carboxylase] ligase
VLAGINRYYKLLQSGGETEIDNEFLSALYLRNKSHLFRSNNEVFNGVITGVNEIGQLQIRKEDGSKVEFHFKEVQFLLNGQ